MKARKQRETEKNPGRIWRSVIDVPGSRTSSPRTAVNPQLDRSNRSLAKGRPGLIDLLNRWDSPGTTIPEDAIRSGLEGLSLNRDDLRECINFNERAYQRNLIHLTGSYEVLVLCWRSGQRSPIHDHGDSTCGVLVLEGIATETSFVASPRGAVAAAHSRRIGAGSLVVSRGGDIHQVANLEPHGVDMITLHVYSPCLSGSRYYRTDEMTIADHDHLINSFPETIMALL
jgi:cysteine dioxygenase